MKSDSTVHDEGLYSPWRVTVAHEVWLYSPWRVTLQSMKSGFAVREEWLQPMKCDFTVREEWLYSPWKVTVRYLMSNCGVHEEWPCSTWRVTSLFLDRPPPNYLSVDSTAVGTSSLAVAGKLEVLAGADRYRGRWLRAREIGWSKRRHHPGIYCHLVYPLMCRTFVIL